jgi:hypothetical protein
MRRRLERVTGLTFRNENQAATPAVRTPRHFGCRATRARTRRAGMCVSAPCEVTDVDEVPIRPRVVFVFDSASASLERPNRACEASILWSGDAMSAPQDRFGETRAG